MNLTFSALKWTETGAYGQISASGYHIVRADSKRKRQRVFGAFYGYTLIGRADTIEGAKAICKSHWEKKNGYFRENGGTAHRPGNFSA